MSDEVFCRWKEAAQGNRETKMRTNIRFPLSATLGLMAIGLSTLLMPKLAATAGKVLYGQVVEFEGKWQQVIADQTQRKLILDEGPRQRIICKCNGPLETFVWVNGNVLQARRATSAEENLWLDMIPQGSPLGQ